MIMDITFGVEPKAKHDPYIEAAEAGIDTINLAGTPGYFLGMSSLLRSFAMLLKAAPQLITSLPVCIVWLWDTRSRNSLPY